MMFPFNSNTRNKFCGGVFEQLARYTMRYQESEFTSWPLFFLIFLQLLHTLLLLLYSSPTLASQFKYSSGFNSQSWACLDQLTGRVSIVYLIAKTATGLLLLGNRLACAQPQLISTKERQVNSRAKHNFKYKEKQKIKTGEQYTWTKTRLNETKT